MIYTVSVVVRKGTEGFDLLLGDGWVRRHSADDALNRFLHTTAEKYPNYAPIRMLNYRTRELSGRAIELTSGATCSRYYESWQHQ